MQRDLMERAMAGDQEAVESLTAGAFDRLVVRPRINAYRVWADGRGDVCRETRVPPA